eukprot:CAMPEP_0174750704 /NCGR_PEP_ID=MMETSP1094-20130205/98311_1 /TAXON_ID=156173 /ORGANISM="Chrysochromulina brevifilum, Strain UTEX LB 985" /LENGTH=63 /DNA_ID=CAMNT_0015956095 /DNA_START=403 /DNA_END=594 /DNA_ORIENTATION=+
MRSRSDVVCQERVSSRPPVSAVYDVHVVHGVCKIEEGDVGGRGDQYAQQAVLRIIEHLLCVQG